MAESGAKFVFTKKPHSGYNVRKYNRTKQRKVDSGRKIETSKENTDTHIHPHTKKKTQNELCITV
jgi:hypothetical protein